MVITRARGPRLPILCDRLYRLAQHSPEISGPARGRRFELAVEAELLRAGFPVRAVPSGVEILGTLPASGLGHQVDAEAWCSECDVIGEWKAYRGSTPKNDVLLFKAKTDDIYEELIARTIPRRSVVRVFGATGDFSADVRRYAARFGIVLIEQSRWPAPVLSDPELHWAAGPNEDERRALAFLTRPMQKVYRQTVDGRLIAPRQLPLSVVDHLLSMQDSVSSRLTANIDAVPHAA